MTNSGPASSPQRPVPLARRPGFLVGFTATVGLLSCMVGLAVMYVFLFRPPSLETEGYGHVVCISVLGSNSVYDEDREDVTSEWMSYQEDQCESLRRERVAVTSLVAVPTAIAGSVGLTALLLRRLVGTAPGQAPSRGGDSEA